jgi:hypothetical protein
MDCEHVRILGLVLSVACAGLGMSLIASAHWSALGRPGNSLAKVVLPGPFAKRSTFSRREWILRWIGFVLGIVGMIGVAAFVVLLR